MWDERRQRVVTEPPQFKEVPCDDPITWCGIALSQDDSTPALRDPLVLVPLHL